MTKEEIASLRFALHRAHGATQIALFPLEENGFNEKTVREAADAATALAAQASDFAQALVVWRQERVVRPGESGRTGLTWKGESVLGPPPRAVFTEREAGGQRWAEDNAMPGENPNA